MRFLKLRSQREVVEVQPEEIPEVVVKFGRIIQMVDNSSSIRSLDLLDPLLMRLTQIEEALSRLPEWKVTRSTFDKCIKDHDREGRQMQFRNPSEPHYIPWSEIYQTGHGTHLETAIETALRRQLYPECIQPMQKALLAHQQQLAQRQDVSPQELMIPDDDIFGLKWIFSYMVTDSHARPGGFHSGPQRQDEIRQHMSRILDIARQFGGIDRTPLRCFYIGLGSSEQFHLDIACGRYGYPEEWVLWRSATTQGVHEAGEAIEKSISEASRGQGTVMNVDDLLDDDHGRTIMGCNDE